MFNYIFPSIDLNFNSAGSQFIKCQSSLKQVDFIKQTAFVKGGYYLQSQRFLILFSKLHAFPYACRTQVNSKGQLHYHILDPGQVSTVLRVMKIKVKQ